MKRSTKWAVSTSLVALVLLVGIASAWQQGSEPGWVTSRPVVEAKAVRASQSAPVLPTPNITPPFNATEYDQANIYCARCIAWLQNMEQMHRWQVDTLHKRLADPTLGNYYSWLEGGQDRWDEINSLIQDYETQINMLSEETNTQVEGLKMMLVSAHLYMEAGNQTQATLAMQVAYDHAVDLVTYTPASFGIIWGFSPLNLMYELDIEIQDMLSEDEHEALINQLNEELGLTI